MILPCSWNNVTAYQCSGSAVLRNGSTARLGRCSATETRSEEERSGPGGRGRTGAGGGTDGAPQPGSSHLQLDAAGLERLGLELGSNRAVFSLTTQFQGTTRAECTVFLWRAGERVVVSDIDGTITRSDKRGMLLPWVGLADWAQAGCSHKPPAIKLVSQFWNFPAVQ